MGLGEGLVSTWTFIFQFEEHLNEVEKSWMCFMAFSNKNKYSLKALILADIKFGGLGSFVQNPPNLVPAKLNAHQVSAFHFVHNRQNKKQFLMKNLS